MSFYKVIYRHSPESLPRSIYSGGACVTYKPGVWTPPVVPGTPLMVFDSLIAAGAFGLSSANELWSCEIKEWRFQPEEGLFYPRLSCTGAHSESELRRFWDKLPLSGSSQRLLTCFPPGTIFASEVRLLEKLKGGDEHGNETAHGLDGEHH